MSAPEVVCSKCGKPSGDGSRKVQEYDRQTDDVSEVLVCRKCYAWMAEDAMWEHDGSTGGLCERQRSKKV